jgi:hypothetical protein
VVDVKDIPHTFPVSSHSFLCSLSLLCPAGECKELECPFKHSLDDVKECNMYKLGFCIYGPNCRYKHTKQPGEARATGLWFLTAGCSQLVAVA